MIRAAVVTVFLVIAVTIVTVAMFLGTDTPLGGFLANLGTEIFGIVITVAVVEYFFERRRLQDRAREIAWSILHGIEQCIWMWQGGPRRMGTDQLLGLAASIDSSDELAPYTQSQLQGLGDRTSQILQRQRAAIKSVGGLEEALNDLTSLKGLGEDAGRTDASRTEIRMIAEILESSTTGLARVLGQPDQRIPGALIRYRDPSVEAQERRHLETRPHLQAEPALAEGIR